MSSMIVWLIMGLFLAIAYAVWLVLGRLGRSKMHIFIADIVVIVLCVAVFTGSMILRQNTQKKEIEGTMKEIEEEAIGDLEQEDTKIQQSTEKVTEDDSDNAEEEVLEENLSEEKTQTKEEKQKSEESSSKRKGEEASDETIESTQEQTESEGEKVKLPEEQETEDTVETEDSVESEDTVETEDSVETEELCRNRIC